MTGVLINDESEYGFRFQVSVEYVAYVVPPLQWSIPVEDSWNAACPCLTLVLYMSGQYELCTVMSKEGVEN
jgi:hypothetical protein